MSDARKTAQCEFELVSAADILDGLGTISGRYGQGIFVPAPGDGPDTHLEWAIQDVNRASTILDKHEQQKLCTNAIINARRALACLVDWYLERDLAIYCENPPRTAEQKANFLVQRGIIDNLTSRVLERAVGKRNEVEHQYRAPKIEIAEDVVELFRRTTAAIKSQSDPCLAPWIFGFYLGGHSSISGTVSAVFDDWSGPMVVFSRFPPNPWVGLVLPDGDVRALVRRAHLNETKIDELIQMLALSERKYGHSSSFMGEPACKAIERELGLA